MAKVTAVFFMFALVGCGGTPPTEGLGSASLASRLPGDGLAGWKMVGNPVLADTDGVLYAQIDGAAPKYIDRGWVKSVYATYRKGNSNLEVAIHDMGNADNAASLYQLDLPVSNLPVHVLPDGEITGVIDTGVPTAYSGEAWVRHFVIETAIDERSDAALSDIDNFLLTTVEQLQ